jgi:methyl-accepting chemotaxis protein
MRISRLTVSTRLLLAFGFIALLMVGVALLGYSAIRGLAVAERDLVHVDVATMQSLGRARYALAMARRAESDAILAMDMPTDFFAHVDRWKKQMAEFDRLMGEIPETGIDGKPLRAELQAAMTSYREPMQRLLPKLMDGSVKDSMGAVLILSGFRGFAEGAEERLAREFTAFADNSEARSRAAEAVAANRPRWMLGASCIAIVVAIVTGLWVRRSVSAPLRHAGELADDIASGDLTRRVETDRKDDVAALLHRLNGMSERLADTIGVVRGASGTIRMASAQIADGNARLSERAQSQVGVLIQSAAAIEQIKQRVLLNVGYGEQAHSHAQDVANAAIRGGTVMKGAVERMEAINASSRKVAEIVSVIDSIAFQTNILALNAAVESARAGEQGRGFAVVAAEVRALARRCSDASRDVRKLIEESSASVDAGVELIASAGGTMDAIVESVNSLNGIISNIVAASHQQSAEMAEIDNSVQSIDRSTQENAALVAQTAHAAQELTGQTRALEERLRFFRTGEPVA